MSKQRPSLDTSIWDRAEVCIKIQAASYKGKPNFVKFWRLARRNGIWSLYKRVPMVCTKETIPLVMDNEAIALYPTVAGDFLGMFKRRTDIEAPLLAAIGMELALPLDEVICDKCGRGARVLVEKVSASGPRVICCKCADGESPAAAPAAH